MNRRAMSKPFRTVTHLALLLLIAACNASPAENSESAPLAGSAIGGDFTLADKTGNTVRWGDFAGQYRIIYFGYSFCPDACPTDVAAMMRGFNQFAKVQPEKANHVQPIFITIDPARDTPRIVGEFAAAFSPRLLGLTGTAAQVDQAAKAFAVYYAKGNQSAGGYLMDHSRTAFLMGRKGEPIAILPVDHGPEAVAAELAKWVK